MIAGLETTAVAVALVLVAFAAGVGCTTLGPGGIFSTVALYTLTDAPSATVAGTAHLTFVAVGLVGTVAYRRSGELLGGTNVRMAAVLSVTSVLGALVGAELNTRVSRDLFGVLLGAFTAAAGVVILYREYRSLPSYDVDFDAPAGQALLAAFGGLLGAAAGLLGVGGPVVAVPVLVVLGVPMLAALGVAQVQAVFIATFATAGYLANGAVSIPLAALVGVPQVIGAVAGWRIAHLIDPERLKAALGLTLLAVGPYLAL